MSVCDYLPRRIVSLQPSATAILESLGALDYLVACTRYCVDLYPDLANSRTILADSWSAQSVEIVASNPDLVIAAVPYQEKAIAEIMKSGARFLGLAPKSLADIYSDITLIAGIVGLPQNGAQVIATMQGEIESVRSRIETAGPPKLRVFCEEWSNPLIASQAWVAELVAAAGGVFIGQPGKQISADEVAQERPEVLVAAWCGAGDRVPLKKIVDRNQWCVTPAATSHHVYCIRDEYLNTPAPTLMRGLHALAAAIHPELFPSPEGLRRITDVHQRVSESSPRC